jgi:tRNA(fMet)-specific endonuclease VapC
LTTGLLLDTNVVSYLYKHNAYGKAYEDIVADAACFLALQTLAELEVWTIRSTWGKQTRANFETYLERFKVVEPNRSISSRWAWAKCETEARGKPMSAQDLWIAATALELGIPLVTHNVSDFEGLPELEIITA